VIGKVAVVVGAVASVFAIVGGIWALGQWLGEKRQDPIRIDSGKVGASQGACVGLTAIVKGDLDPSKDLDYYEDNGLLIYENPALQMDVVSQVKDETLKVAPYLLVKTTDITPLRKPVDFIGEATGACGGGSYDQFFATLAPNREKVFGAPQAPGWEDFVKTWRQSDKETKQLEKAVKAGYLPEHLLKAGRVPADYFTLKPTGEREVFQIAFNTNPGYLYRFRVGVQYSYSGDEDVIWTDKEFEVTGYPLKADFWYVNPFSKNPENIREYNKGSLELGGPMFPTVDVQDQRMYIQKSIEYQEEELQKYQLSFEPP
jgi:hypothetical protein